MLLLQIVDAMFGIAWDKAILSFKFALLFALLQQASYAVFSRIFSEWDKYPFVHQRKLTIIVNSLIHCMFIFAVGVYLKVSGEDDYLALDRYHNTSPWSDLLMAFSAGYFLWDTFIIAAFRPTDVPFLLHGIGCFIVYWTAQRPNLQFFAWRLLIFELSTPLMNVRQFIVIVYKTSWVLKYIEWMFGVVFFLVRLVWGLWLKVYLNYYLLDKLSSCWKEFWLVDSSDPDLGRIIGELILFSIYVFLTVGLALLNVFWLYAMAKKALKSPSTSVKPARKSE